MPEILYYGDGGDEHARVALALLLIKGLEYTYIRCYDAGDLYAYTGSETPPLPVVVVLFGEGSEPEVLIGATRDSLSAFLESLTEK